MSPRIGPTAIAFGVSAVMIALGQHMLHKPMPYNEETIATVDDSVSNTIAIYASSIEAKERIMTEYRSGKLSRQGAVRGFLHLLQSNIVIQRAYQTRHPELSDESIAELNFVSFESHVSPDNY